MILTKHLKLISSPKKKILILYLVIFIFFILFESVANPIMLETVFQLSLENLVYLEHSTNLSDNKFTNIKVKLIHC